MNFEQIEDCMPDGAVSLTDGLTGVTAQWLHEFAHEVAAKERKACAKLCDSLYYRHGHACDDHPTADDAARAIRARSNAALTRRP